MLKWIKSCLPTKESLKKSRTFSWVSNWLKGRPYLWQFQKHSVSSGIAISLFVAFLPLPFEMLIVTLLAITFHANLPISILSTWITNPFTLIPANYACYRVGVWLLDGTNGEYIGLPEINFNWHDWSGMLDQVAAFFGSISKAYLVGLPIVSISAGLAGYGLVYFIWTAIEFFSKKRG